MLSNNGMLFDKALPKTVEQLHALCCELQTALTETEKALSETELPECGIKVAPSPRVMLPKALGEASLLADVIASKFVDALSFYRKDKILKREGIDIGCSTLCDWPIQLTQRLDPLKRLLYEQLQHSDLWRLDETTLRC